MVQNLLSSFLIGPEELQKKKKKKKKKRKKKKKKEKEKENKKETETSKYNLGKCKAKWPETFRGITRKLFSLATACFV